MNEIVPPLTIPEVIDAYNDAKKRLEFHFMEIDAIRNKLCSSGVADLYFFPKKELAEALGDLKKKTWRTLLCISGAEKVLSVKRMDEFENMLSSQKVQEPTQEAITDLLMNGNAKALFNEMIEETYNFLRPGASWRNHLKTNEKNAKYHLGEKIILTNVFFANRYFLSMSDLARSYLAATDKIFHLLDKKPYNYNAYSSPLVDTMSKNDSGETEYFRWIRYKNGNLHLFFKREDLLKMFNQIAGSIDPALGG